MGPSLTHLATGCAGAGSWWPGTPVVTCMTHALPPVVLGTSITRAWQIENGEWYMVNGKCGPSHACMVTAANQSQTYFLVISHVLFSHAL